MSFLTRNYLKLLVSGFIGTSTLLISGVIDGLVAGRCLSAAGLTAVSLASPFFCVNSFLSSLVLSGGSISINQSLGSKNMALANRQFSSMLYAQAAIGALFTLCAVALLDVLPALLGGTAQTSEMIRAYLGGIAPFMFVFPITAFMSGMAFYDGDTLIATAGQVLIIASNVVLSVQLSGMMGIRGIGVATVVSNVLGCAVYALHFLRGKCPMRLVRAFSIREVADMARIGLPGIGAYLFVAAAVAAVNNYLGRSLGEYALYLFAIVNTVTGSFANLPQAAGEALAPLASLYCGEGNSLMLHRLIRLSLKAALILSFIALIPLFFFPEALCALYAVPPERVADVVRVLRLSSLALFPIGIVSTMVIYYMVSGHTFLALLCSILHCLVLYVGSFWALGALAPGYIWLAISLSEGLTLAALLLVTKLIGRKKSLSAPLLLKRADEDQIRVWDFSSRMDRFLTCGGEAERFLEDKGVSAGKALSARLVLEELGVLLSQYRCQVEVNCLIGESVELIVRDNSPKWDIANEDGVLTSFQQYAALQILNKKAKKQFFRAIGCNKISFEL